MARYIDAEELISYIKSTMDMQDLYLPAHFITAIYNIETANVQEVKHGKWEFRDGVFRCSICGDFVSCGSIHCPICGAKMDKE